MLQAASIATPNHVTGVELFWGQPSTVLIGRLAPSGTTTIRLGAGTNGYSDPNPEAWNCYVAFFLLSGQLIGPSDVVCYFALGTLFQSRWINISIQRPSGAVPKAIIGGNPGTLISIPLATLIPAASPGPPQVFGGQYVEPPISEPTCYYIQHATEGGGVDVPVSDMVCAFPRTS